MKALHLTIAVAAIFSQGTALAQAPASSHTVQANKAAAASLPQWQQDDFANASRGLIATLPGNRIDGPNGKLAWDGQRFDFLQGAAPDSVNPSLWRNGMLNRIHGLFKVQEGIYQLRGYDVSNMTLIAGKTGWIVVDPLVSAETARATLELAQQHLGRRPVSAVIFTHGHIDHFGGVLGVASMADMKSGKVPVIAPQGFMDSALSENVLAGGAMSRRAVYQFGMHLPYGQREGVGNGLGIAASNGTPGIAVPTVHISANGQKQTVDGVPMVFYMANDSEAPHEFMFYLPEQKALCLSEVASQTMHNIYTLRGAKARDSLNWSKYLNAMIDMFPEAETSFASHNWPVWGKSGVRAHLEHQRDMYRFLNDRTLNLANDGMTMQDLSNQRFYPRGLLQDNATRGYYGSLSQNLRGVFNFYLGWYDSNPATLDPLPRVESAQRFIKAIGGADAALQQLRAAFDAGDYRWAAELGSKLVFAEPGNKAARDTHAATLEQLGYQTESAVWRNEYLSAARELRDDANRKPSLQTASPDIMRAMPLELVFDSLAVRLNHEKVDGLALGLNLSFTDTGERFALELSNAVLNNTAGRTLAKPSASLVLTRAALFDVLLGKVTFPASLQSGAIKLEGDPKAVGAILGNLKTYDPAFPMVAPKP
jgi:alkyl sulfatase BDS1-like metallo-beta-lactamase superfamily hydrolase